MTFVEIIRAARESKGITQKQLAQVLNIDVPMYSRIERGERQAKRDQVIQIARQLGIDEKELVHFWLADIILKIIPDSNEAKAVFSIITKRFD